MYTVVRQYSGQGVSQLFEALENKKDEVEASFGACLGL